MPLQKLQFRPGIVRDTTSLAAEGGWYACDKVRFRMGFPEKIGGWGRISDQYYLGTCRTLSCWRSFAGVTYIGVGTHLKFYIAAAGAYYDITPLRATNTIVANAFTTTNASSVVVVNDSAHLTITGDYVTVTGSVSAVGGIPAAAFNAEFTTTFIDANTYSIDVGVVATSAATGGNGVFAYQLNVGNQFDLPTAGWGAGGWSVCAWGDGCGTADMRFWTQLVYGNQLLFGPRGGQVYYWDPAQVSPLTIRGLAIATLAGASSTPLFQNGMTLDAASRILVLYGSNPYGTTDMDPMLVRWSGAESLIEWAPAITNQAGEYRLTQGTQILSAQQTRTETLILTDTAAFAMQYVGGSFVFSFSKQSANISCAGPYAATTAGATVYWMGRDKFYVYDGRVQTLPCSLRNEVFNDINVSQGFGVVAGTNESYDEIWWFYPSANSATPNRYVVYNYTDKIWYYGTLERTAWLDTPFQRGPLAATNNLNIVEHELGNDDITDNTAQPIVAFVQSADFDIGDGHTYGFVRQILPDVSFSGSTGPLPVALLEFSARDNPGGTPRTSPTQSVSRAVSAPVEEWTEIVYVRVRGRQMNIRLSSNGLGVKWQIGTPRIEVRPDGRRA